MDPDRWQEVESIFQKALDAGEKGRGRVLEAFCGGDQGLRREVESLLAQHEKAGDFLEIPIIGALSPDGSVAALSGLEKMVVGHFRILHKIGSGGMGVVYEAEDLKLRRHVALKFLPEELANDAQSLQRFRLEARAASALNHPGICTIYEVDEAQGRLFIAMELLEGQTLREMISGQPLPLETVLDLGIQIAAAIDCAHVKGIVHRDLKPANIFVVQRRRIKILDFGLAKLVRRQTDSEGTEFSLDNRTEPGMMMGTIGYVAPEQVRGQPADHRADVFAFGTIVYEMLTGKRAFEKPTAAETMTAILNEEPTAIAPIAPSTPLGLVRVVKRCLEKNPEQRFQSASDLAFALEAVSESGSTPMAIAGAAGRSRGTPRGKAFRYGAICAIAAAAIAIVVWSTPSPISPLDSTQITDSAQPKEAPLFTDGSRLYFQSRGVPSQMATSGGIIAPMSILPPGFQLLDISSDGSKALALHQDLDDNLGRGTLWAVNMLGGAPRRLFGHLTVLGRWSPDGHSIVFTDHRTLYRIDGNGTNLSKIWDADGDVFDLGFSPDARQLTATVSTHGTSHVWIMNADGKNAHRLALNWPPSFQQFDGKWTLDGRHFVFLSDLEGHNNVYQLVSPAWFEFWKKPSAVRITGNQVDIQALAPSHDSKNLFVIGQLQQGAMRVLDARTGKFRAFLDGLPALEFVISPDRQWMAFTDFPTRFLWKSKLDGTGKIQLTGSHALMQQWSPDGKSLVYSDWHKLYLVSAEGGAPQQLIPTRGAVDSVPWPTSADDEVAPSWSPDGKSIVFNYFPSPGSPLTGIHVVDLASRKLSVMPGSEGYYVPSWSPDGKFLVAIAQNPARMVLYSAASKTWRDLKLFDAPWGYWIWSHDSKSLYMAQVSGQNGIYRLTVPEGAWTKVSGLDGVDNPSSLDSFPSLTADGQPVLMGYTGVAQIYSLSWMH